MNISDFTLHRFLKAHANGRNKSQHCCMFLGAFGQQCCVRLHGPGLTGFKLYATSANIIVVPCKRTQQVTTLLGPTMLGVIGQQCWIRLHGPLVVSHSVNFKMKYLNVKYRSWSYQDSQKLQNNASSHYPTTIFALCIYFLQYEHPL